MKNEKLRTSIHAKRKRKHAKKKEHAKRNLMKILTYIVTSVQGWIVSYVDDPINNLKNNYSEIKSRERLKLMNIALSDLNYTPKTEIKKSSSQALSTTA